MDTTREYATLYHAPDDLWAVIYREKEFAPDKWYIYIQDAGNERTAREIARSMNGDSLE